MVSIICCICNEKCSMDRPEMLGRCYIASFLLLCFCLRAQGLAERQLQRRDFPPGFVFGTGSSAYQYEGAAKEDGRGPSIWDTFPPPAGDANDQYHRYEEDIKLLVNMGIDSYRFSISWSRIFLDGRGTSKINFKGVSYYNKLIDELLKNGIQPFVTIFHWDLPQALQDEYGGFLSREIVKDFTYYARTCFELFGDRVKYWTTINEPLNVALYGYDLGIHAPGRCSTPGRGCTAGNSSTEPYIVAHNLLLSHAAAVELYRHEYQAKQKGSIGIALDTYWVLPCDRVCPSDVKAQQQILDFYFGWFMNPITSGEYPASMRRLVGARLPHFNRSQSQLLRGSFDFIGINYYTALYANMIYYTAPLSYKNVDSSINGDSQVTKDSRVNLTSMQDGQTWEPTVEPKCENFHNCTLRLNRTGSYGESGMQPWVYGYAPGINLLLSYVKDHYDNPPVFITENGIDESLDDVEERFHGTNDIKNHLNDTKRIQYHLEHLNYTLQAIRGGSDVRGYFTWGFSDSFEWNSGYDIGFGFHYIDRNDNLRRYPKCSARWLASFLGDNPKYNCLNEKY